MADWHLKMFYDAQCPFCRLEARWLGRWNRKGRLVFEDISNPDFDPSTYGLTQEQVRRTLYGVLHNGRVVSGIEVFRQAYRALGLGWLAVPTGWPVLRPILDAAYRLFARQRVRMGRLMDRDCSRGACSVRQLSTGGPKDAT